MPATTKALVRRELTQDQRDLIVKKVSVRRAQKKIPQHGIYRGTL